MMQRTLGIAVGLMGLWCLVAFAEESPQDRLARVKELQARIAQRERAVVRAPDDRKAYRALLVAGLELYDHLYPGPRFPEDMRDHIVNLKLVMEDMYTLQQTINDMGSPLGFDGRELANRLQSRKVPPAHRRAVPLVDPWGTAYRFYVYPGNGAYKIVSAGSDRAFDPANLGLSAQEATTQMPEKRAATLSGDIVFIAGRNFTNIFDYPERAQTFLYTRCQPADEPESERVRCW
jgi:hypothetical protein